MYSIDKLFALSKLHGVGSVLSHAHLHDGAKRLYIEGADWTNEILALAQAIAEDAVKPAQSVNGEMQVGGYSVKATLDEDEYP